MKTLLSLLMLSVGLLVCRADFTLTRGDLIKLYGQPQNPNDPLDIPAKYHSEGVDVFVYWLRGNKVSSVLYSRSAPFYASDLDALLAPIAFGEKWVKKDDKTWVLPSEKLTAKWDGECKVTITAHDAPAN